MPIDRTRYSPDWEAISQEIRFERAGGQCECMGECGHSHGFICAATHGEPHPVTGSVVVLTVAHLDHDPSNNDSTNLKAMCQRCHLNYDAELHRKNAAITRRQKRIDAGQMEMDFEEKKCN